MNRQVLRSVCNRARPELQIPAYTPSNYFSTTQWLGAEGESTGGNPKPLNRSRSRAAVNEISSLVGERRSTPSSNQGPRPPSSLQSGAAPKVLDVRSLPRGFRGRGGLRGRGGPSLAGGSRFGSARGSSVRGGRGGRGARGGRGSRGAARGGKRREGGEEGSKDSKENRFRKNEVPIEPDEAAFYDAIKFGVNTVFNPSVTAESLADHVPAWPTTPAGRAATALRNLSILGGEGDAVGAPRELQPKDCARDLERGGVRFFADAQSREATEEYMREKRRAEAEAKGEVPEQQQAATIIGPADEAVRKVVVDRALSGQYEEPKFAADPVGIARSWHLRSETYTAKDLESFEKKLKSLVARTGGKSGGAPGKQRGAAARV